jgi:hypothetical protein
MGQLKPGATYIYERNKNVVYAREFGADPATRQVIGWDYDPENPLFDPRSEGQKEVDDLREWSDIRLAGKKNPTLQKAIDNVKIIYKMVRDDNEQ